ncbi:peroxiredoxin family protein [Echinicola shivajiensis]|uniref:peroxiredoxin family protein n=1 Tax=Echinicola shivajiensis TaxID=1035916 RepID=UPI001BFCBD22|nr:TlpA disulfide reductase family protein [Echinicola shivajiensis]
MKYKIFIIWAFIISLPLMGFGQSEDLDGEDMSLPDFSLVDLEGNTFTDEDFRGSYLVLHIATTWCPFCNAEAPYLQELAEDYQDKNVKVLIIDVKEPAELVREKLQDKFNFTFPVLLDEDGEVAASFAPQDVLPDLARDEVMLASNMLIDKEGNIRFMSLLDSKNFDAKLVALKAKLDEILEEN